MAPVFVLAFLVATAVFVEAKVFVYDRLGAQLSQSADTATAPTIIQQPANQLLRPGGVVRFHVVAAGAGPISYQWQHENSDIPGATTDTLEVPGLAANLGDYGVYAVVVRNSSGSVTSSEATVLADGNANGLPDNWEQRFLTNPVQKPWDDRDGDGISNYDEYLNGTTSPDAFDFFLVPSWTRYAASVRALPAQKVLSGQAFQIRLAAVGDRSVFSSPSLPVGLSLNPSSGLLSSAALPAGRFGLTVTALGNAGTSASDVTIDSLEVSSWLPVGLLLETPPGVADTIAVAAGKDYSLALGTNGAVQMWRAGDVAPNIAIAASANAVALASGDDFAVALRENMTLRGWPAGLSIPGAAPPSGVTNGVAVAAGRDHALCLRADGTVVGWGSSASTSAWTVPDGLANVKAVAAGSACSAALKADGTVVVWGDAAALQPPADLGRVVSLVAGSGYIGALLATGDVRVWGNNPAVVGQIPSGIADTVQLAGGANHLVVLKRDGTARAWGVGWGGVTVTGIAGVGAGQQHSVVLSRYGSSQRPMLVVPRFVLVVQGQPVHVPILAKGSASLLSATGLPAGLGIDPATGVIGGVTSAAGVHNAVLTVSNVHGADSKTLTFHVVAPAPDFRLINSSLVFRSGGPAAWTMQSSVVPPGKTSAARSGNPASSTPSWFETELTGPALLAYTRKTEGGALDRLRCIVGNTTVEEVTGASGWQEISVQLPTGLQRIRWEFSSGQTPASVSAAAFISQVAVLNDMQKPLITLLGPNPMNVVQGSVFTDPGAKVTDNVDAERIIAGSGTVNTSLAGNYTLTYSASDVAGNAAPPVTRVVTVAAAFAPDTQSPLITLLGPNPMNVVQGSVFTDPGAKVTDNVDAERIIAGSGTVNTSVAGNYTLTYSASDVAGNAAPPVERSVAVVAASPPPSPVVSQPSVQKGKAKGKAKAKPKAKGKAKKGKKR